MGLLRSMEYLWIVTVLFWQRICPLVDHIDDDGDGILVGGIDDKDINSDNDEPNEPVVRMYNRFVRLIIVTVNVFVISDQ